MEKKLYKNVIQIDSETGEPADFESLYVGYSNLIHANYNKLGISQHGAEDAIQEVQLKFWLKGGMKFFDPNKGKHFSGMYRNWTAMFLLQERDKYVKYHSRYVPTGFNRDDDKLMSDFSERILLDDAMQHWIKNAEEVLTDKPKLIKVLHMCVEAAEQGQTVTRAMVAKAAGIKLSEATATLKQLRQTLEDAELGVGSIHAL